MSEPPQLHEPERREGYKEIAKTIDDRMHYLEVCFQRWLRRGLIGFAVIGLACTLGLLGFGIVLHNQSRTDKEIKSLAVGANTQSQAAIGAVFSKEKICADSSTKDACQALFDRLTKSLTEKQKLQLSCLAIKNIEGKVAESLKRENPNC